MRVKEAIRFVIDAIREIYSERESESIAYLVLESAGIPGKKVFAMQSMVLEKRQEEIINKAVKELVTSRPVQYVLGGTEFYGLKFLLDENVLIPRQETEEIVHRIIRENNLPAPRILDLGTGSGCIAVSLAKNINTSVVYATDISEKALKTARSNAGLNKVNISFLRDDILNTSLENNMRFDIIVSNPPYVRELEKKFMHANVVNFEPASALFVKDENPLEFYRAIAEIALEKLLPGGSLYVEINENFGMEVSGLFLSKGLVSVEIIRDMNEKNRFVKALKAKV